MRPKAEWAIDSEAIIELLENATPESIRKATNYGMKIFQGKNLPKLLS